MDIDGRQRLEFSQMRSQTFPFYEFFAGGGMARLGLGPAWNCAFANEWCQKKAAAYRDYFGESPELKVCDVAALTPDDLLGTPTLVWASFPCQDLSLAGNGAGLAGDRSGTFRPFWKLMQGMIGGGRIPQVVVLENVAGTLTSHDGRDFAAILGALVQADYRILPRCRPWLFMEGVYRSVGIPSWPAESAAVRLGVACDRNASGRQAHLHVAKDSADGRSDQSWPRSSRVLRPAVRTVTRTEGRPATRGLMRGVPSASCTRGRRASKNICFA